MDDNQEVIDLLSNQEANIPLNVMFEIFNTETRNLIQENGAKLLHIANDYDDYLYDN